MAAGRARPRARARRPARGAGPRRRAGAHLRQAGPGAWRAPIADRSASTTTRPTPRPSSTCTPPTASACCTASRARSPSSTSTSARRGCRRSARRWSTRSTCVDRHGAQDHRRGDRGRDRAGDHPGAERADRGPPNRSARLSGRRSENPPAGDASARMRRKSASNSGTGAEEVRRGRRHRERLVDHRRRSISYHRRDHRARRRSRGRRSPQRERPRIRADGDELRIDRPGAAIVAEVHAAERVDLLSEAGGRPTPASRLSWWRLSTCTTAPPGSSISRTRSATSGRSIQ